MRGKAASSDALRRTFDLSIAVPALAAASIPILFACAAVQITMGSPVLFKQQRYGLRGQKFTIYKIRSMSDTRDASGALLPDIDRLSGLGSALRHYGIDELPQLWNVIRGDMSIVGPRPLWFELDLSGFQERWSMKPGLFSLAKIADDQSATYSDERSLALDLKQIRNASLKQDIVIIFKTVGNLVSGRHDPFTRQRGSQDARLSEKRLEQRPYP